MRNQIDIDNELRRAIFREIGERLQGSLREGELPTSLRVQLDRLDHLDDQLSPSVLPELEPEKVGKNDSSAAQPNLPHAVDYAVADASPKGAQIARLEGAVSKHRDRPYQAGRSKAWVKIKNRQHPAMSRVREALS